MAKLLRDDVDRFFDYSLHVPSRTVFMGTEVDEVMVEFFLKGFTLLDASSDTPIHVVMNNVGGDEYHGLAIYDAIATSRCHVKLTAYGHAMSMGSWIMQAADERVLAPNATMMLHLGSVTLDGEVKYVRVWHKEMERLTALMEDTYLKRMKERDPAFPLRKLRKMLEDEAYLTAVEAVELGLADRILG